VSLRLRWLLAGPYLGLVLLAAAYLAYRLNFQPVNSEFAGLPLILLAEPWAIWLDQMIGTASGPLGWIGILAGVTLNSTLLYLAGRALERLH